MYLAQRHASLFNKDLLTNLVIFRCMLWEWVKISVVGVGLVKVCKTSIRLARGALSIPLLMSMSEAFYVPFYTLIKLCYTKAIEWSSLVPGPKAKSSEIVNLTLFTISCQTQHINSSSHLILTTIHWGRLYHYLHFPNKEHKA